MRALAIVTMLAALAAAAARAEPARDTLLAGYAAQARGADPGFSGFSAARGRALYLGPHGGGKPETPACATCHTSDPTGPGRNLKTDRAIEPMAARVNPARFTDAAQVEKRFARDCPNVLGRECSARDKGDFITFLSTLP